MNEKCRILFVVKVISGGVLSYILDLENEVVKSYDGVNREASAA